MVKDTDLNQRQRFLQATGDQFIGLTRFRDTARVVVYQDASGGISGQRFLHHFPRMDRSAIQGSSEQLLPLDKSMPVVDVDDTEYFVRTIAQSHREVLTHGAR